MKPSESEYATTWHIGVSHTHRHPHPQGRHPVPPPPLPVHVYEGKVVWVTKNSLMAPPLTQSVFLKSVASPFTLSFQLSMLPPRRRQVRRKRGHTQLPPSVLCSDRREWLDILLSSTIMLQPTSVLSEQGSNVIDIANNFSFPISSNVSCSEDHTVFIDYEEDNSVTRFCWVTLVTTNKHPREWWLLMIDLQKSKMHSHTLF